VGVQHRNFETATFAQHAQHAQHEQHEEWTRNVLGMYWVPVVAAVESEDGAKGTVCGPSHQVAAHLASVVAAAVAVHVRFEVVNT
jgi:hypothetical protein